MKFDKSKTFPYPVLRPYSDDYVEGEFQSTVSLTIEDGSVKVSCSYLTSSVELQQLITDQKAQFVSIVSCRETYFRQTLRTSNSDLETTISTDDLRGEVFIDSYIVATKEIKNFVSPDINPEFEQKRFNFKPGEILAQEETQAVYIERDLFRPISSVFELVKNDALSGGEWRVSLEQDHVQISVSPSMKGNIDNSRSSSAVKSVLINSIYHAAVTHAIQQLKDGNDYADLKWAGVMTRQLHNQNIDLIKTDAYLIAQKLMKHPLSVLNTYIFTKAENA
jgi:hypothetical protein